MTKVRLKENLQMSYNLNLHLRGMLFAGETLLLLT